MYIFKYNIIKRQSLFIILGRRCPTVDILQNNNTDVVTYNGVFEDVHLIVCNLGYATNDGILEFNMTCTWTAEWDQPFDCFREYTYNKCC